VRAFDGHNDTLLAMHLAGLGPEDVVEGDPRLAIDLPRARRGGLAGGLWAMFVPSGYRRDAAGAVARDPLEVVPTDDGYAVVPPAPVDHATAVGVTRELVELARGVAAASAGAVELVTDVAGLDRCRREDRLAMVLHLEGAEAVDPDLTLLPVWHEAGIRSIGPVWSRDNAFGHGVPFRFPHSPDTGPGLTAAGRELVRRCNDLGILVDCSHLNAAGFWDVAALSRAPLVATHSAAHARCAVARNLTDDQLDAVAASDGVVGIAFDVSATRPDGADDADTPLAEVVAHMAYVAQRVGVRHVAMGSDWDGARMPADLQDPCGLPALAAEMRRQGFSAEDVEDVAWRSWRRVLDVTWRGG
jgi:membrane dipeptidase